MKNTIITIKNLLFAFSLATLITTQKNHCMESNSGELSKEQLLKIACDDIDALYKNHRYSPIQAIITLQDCLTIGYGNQFCINALNKANIPTYQYQPLAPVNIKTHNTDLTETLPLEIRQEIHAITEQLLETTEQKIQSLYSQNMTTQEKKDWIHHLAIIMYNIKTTKKMHKRNRLSALNDIAFDNKIRLLNEEINNQCKAEQYETSKELAEARIMHCQYPLDHPLVSNRHGTNGYTAEKLRNDCVNNALLKTKMPLIKYLNSRETTGK